MPKGWFTHLVLIAVVWFFFKKSFIRLELQGIKGNESVPGLFNFVMSPWGCVDASVYNFFFLG